MEWYLYMIRCSDGSFYTGITVDVDRRLSDHRSNSGKGARYLRGRNPMTLVFQMKLGNKSLALIVENKVKKLSKKRKEQMIDDTTIIDEIIKQVAA
jgi:putative endonuclease